MPRNFTIGDCVYARNYGAGPKWLPGHIVKVEGSVLYHIKLRDGRVQRRHIDQLRSRLVDCLDTTTSPNVEPDNGPQLTDGGPTDQETVADIVPDPPPDSIETSEPETTAEPRPSELQPQSNELGSNAEQTRDTTQESPQSPEPRTESQSVTLRRSTRVRHPPHRYDGVNT